MENTILEFHPLYEWAFTPENASFAAFEKGVYETLYFSCGQNIKILIILEFTDISGQAHQMELASFYFNPKDPRETYRSILYMYFAAFVNHPAGYAGVTLTKVIVLGAPL